MYAKIFAQIYDGTLCTKGPWQALVTFQQLLVLADQDGQVDMTAAAIARRTTIPLEIITLGIEELLKEDPDSRTPTNDGRRILPLCEGRGWGWRIVNYKHYRALKREEERREYHRQYWHKRQAKKGNSTKNSTTQPDTTSLTGTQATPPIAEAEAKAKAVDVSVDTLSGKPDVSLPASGKKLSEAVQEVLDFLNEKTGKHYQMVNGNIKFIAARLREGYTVDELRMIVAKKCRDWKGDDKMQDFLRPATLFNSEKCAQYRGEIG